MQNERLPGDAYFDRYLPNLTAEQRIVARERLVAFARSVIRAGEKLKAIQEAVRSTESPDGARIELSDKTDSV